MIEKIGFILLVAILGYLGFNILDVIVLTLAAIYVLYQSVRAAVNRDWFVRNLSEGQLEETYKSVDQLVLRKDIEMFIWSRIAIGVLLIAGAAFFAYRSGGTSFR